MSAVDAHGRFIYSQLDWSGSTNDSTAFQCCALDRVLRNSELPEDLHGVGDEAFSAFSPQILTPYSRRSLRRIQANDLTNTYGRKRTFNYLLSFQRCTVERSFGMLVRKFLVLTRAFECNRIITRTIFRVLHNLCVTEWIKEHPDVSENYSHISENSAVLSDQTIMNQMESQQPLQRQPNNNSTAFQGPRRDRMAKSIEEAGFIYTGSIGSPA
jgi:hypothetical protein